MPNKKGGYKIVSLNGLDLVGESLAITGLYDKLANSYNKPILVTGIVINGEKKKNAFVQVEVLDDGIKINDLYGYDLLVEEDGDITVSANPQELPATTSASEGNVLLLDAQKKPVWGAISGGTKLYKHELVVTESGASFTRVLLISPYPEQYTLDYLKNNNGEKVKDVIQSYLLGSYPVQALILVTYAGVTAIKFGVPSEGQEPFRVTGSIQSITSDTVTEL